MSDLTSASADETYSYLGPAGTFTEAALKQAPEARGKVWRPVNNVLEALGDVVDGRSVGAMIAIENSIEGGVTASQDALAAIPGLRIRGEYTVQVQFSLAVRPGIGLDDITTVAAHPVAYGQCRRWLQANIPGHRHITAASNIASAGALFDPLVGADAAITPPNIRDRIAVDVLAENIQDNQDTRTRFVLVGVTKEIPPRTGADKTSLIVELPEERPGALLEMLEQFATRGINMSMITSRPIPERIGEYRFVIDIDGHLHDARVRDALLGLRRYSRNVLFLGSYPRADHAAVHVPERSTDAQYELAGEWLASLEG